MPCRFEKVIGILISQVKDSVAYYIPSGRVVMREGSHTFRF